MGITVSSLSGAVSRIHAAMPVLEQELNAADARLGDGDTGSMLARVVETMAKTDLAAIDDVGVALSRLAKAMLSATGSSLGTLMATGLMTASRQVTGRTSIEWVELSKLVGAARDATLLRGGASLGDKTVVDGLDAVSCAVSGIGDRDGVATASTAAVSRALSDFRDRPCRIGRARMFPEKSIGADDPGMLALSRVVALLGGWQGGALSAVDGGNRA